MKYRSLGKMLLLSIVTLTIYQIFWLYNTKKELVASGGHIPAFKWLLAPYIAMLLILIFGLVTLGLGSDASSDSVNGLLWFVLIIPISVTVLIYYGVALWWFVHYCKAAEQVTKGEMSFKLSYVLAIVLSLINLGFIWPFIMQNSYNKVGQGIPLPKQSAAPTPIV
jgi:hypothetical protein